MSTYNQNDSATRSKSDSSQLGENAKEAASRAAVYVAEQGQIAAKHYVAEPAKDLVTLLKEYAQEKPDVAACWCFGLGVLVGWKLRG